MSVGGIGPGAGHIGAAQSTRTANALSSAGSAAFGTLMDMGTVAAGMFGGPAAASALSSFRGGVSGSLSSGGNDLVGGMVNDIKSSREQKMRTASNEAKEDDSFQMDLARLQRAVNAQSQTSTMMANMQKARHDAMMSAIRNIS